MRTNLWEDRTFQSGPLKVDRAAGVIRGLKICGLESRNGRLYPHATLKEAVRLYAGRPANLNHHTERGKPADVEKRIGQWRDPVIKPDGVYGDLHVLKSHPMAAVVFEMAERMPDVIGVSHNSEGDADLREGKYVVSRIHQVHSADLVAEPATTRGLFEHFAPAARSHGPDVIPRYGLGDRRRLLEIDGQHANNGYTALPGATGTDPLRAGFKAKAAALVDACLAGEMTPQECVSGLRKLLDARDKLGDDDGYAESMDARAIGRFLRGGPAVTPRATGRYLTAADDPPLTRRRPTRLVEGRRTAPPADARALGRWLMSR
jgi:hypothetical protein